MAFNFGQTGTGGFAFGAPKTTAAATPGFGLQTSAPAGGGFSFGAGQPQTQTLGNPPSQLAGLLAQPTQNSGSTQGGFGFGGQPQSTAPSGGFSFGASLPKLSAPAASQPATTSVTLGASSAGAGFSFGGLTAPTTAAQQPLGGFGFGTPKVQASSAAPAQPTPALSLGALPTGLTLGASTIASTASTTAINFGIKTSATPAPSSAAQIQSLMAPVSSLFAAPIASTPATGFTLGSSMASVAPVLTSASIAPTSLSLKPLGAAPAIITAAASTGATTGFSLGLKPAASIAPATITSTSAVTTSTAPVLSYAQLEALINKWSSELEDQERHFLQQATQVNAWDRMLVENGEKITALHKDMEKVKLDQRRLDQELDFILSQQKELEDLLGPLEESVKEQSGTIYMQNADEERERTYKLAENVDAQLKRMSQDLKEIIEHLNTSSGPADTTDPLQQICKILNAHMDSLQWVEQNSALLQRRVEEVSKLCESRSKEQEKSFRLNFQ
ncbi:nuclear pore glycoprotein p62-like [Sinocyclocheilus rhinocerous]|uniref:Nuclear pore glycoprotein p62 n=1 Tax=Sinocyclocheilus rhinocerous TaxID=307959 RepID=A0A673GTB5_9TELE|nr:PREDICTED: nuclear pore glycoprotein p62-like [Sinocyclocheilus rhinocerous]XP_016398468.1 PREDICTED: nuclear pore glycoprotein p62-like [Sinocyclocheilus rhinocerous]